LQNTTHQICRKLLVEKFGHGNESQWLDVDYEKLREEIYAQAKTLISKNTLKRYFGKLSTGKQYDPQRETKNAFAQYLGYQDWINFENSNAAKADALPELNPVFSGAKRKQTFLKISSVVLFVAALILTVAYWSRKKSEKVPAWFFKVENSIDTTPFSMVARYKVKASRPDTFFIKLLKTEFLEPKDTILTTMVPIPTFTWLSLGYKGKIIKQFPVHGLSRGWEVYYQRAQNQEFLSVPKPYCNSQKGLGISKSWFVGKSLDSVSFNQDFLHFKNFNLKGDHFSAEVIATINKPTDLCKMLTFRFFGSNKHLEFRVGPQFCSQHNFVNLAEKFFIGRRNNLSEMYIPYDHQSKIKLEVKAGVARITIDGKSVFEGKFESKVGLIKGIRISCDGFANIHSFKAWNEKGILVENNLFEKVDGHFQQ